MMDGSEALVRGAAQGDRPSIDGLLADNLPRLQAYVRLQAGDLVRAREGMSDLVQSVCLELLEGLDDGFEYRGEAAFRAWLYTAASRKIADRARYWRAKKRDVAREVPQARGEGDRADELLGFYGSFCTPSRVVAAKEEVERVEQAFEELPEHYRAVIMDSRILGMSHQEIAERMGKSPGAVRVLLHRALAELSESLG